MKFFEKTKEYGNLPLSLLKLLKNLRKKYPRAASVEAFLNNHYTPSSARTQTLDLGCGNRPRNPFQATQLFGVDIRDNPEENIRQADLSSGPIPFGNNMFDFCTAFDFIEHIPRNSWSQGNSRLAFIELMNEIYRVLKPEGMFLHFTPAFPSKEAFQDPTHVNIITEDTMPCYFCEPFNWAKEQGHGYGFNGSFELIEQRWVHSIWLIGLMRALK
jgi:SAM-dependent methyltransferase